MDHKAWCSCQKCFDARAFAKSQRRHKIPNFVMAQFKEKRAKEEQEMLARGYILMTCKSCKHTTFSKIGPVMKCGACCKPLS